MTITLTGTIRELCASEYWNRVDRSGGFVNARSFQVQRASLPCRMSFIKYHGSDHGNSHCFVLHADNSEMQSAAGLLAEFESVPIKVAYVATSLGNATTATSSGPLPRVLVLVHVVVGIVGTLTAPEPQK